MQNSGLMHFVSKVVWLLTALAAINIGLTQFGYDFYLVDFVASKPSVVMVIRYAMLVAGVLSLAMFAMRCSSGCSCACENSGK